MVIKVYVSVISCSQEVKKNQQRAVMILESKNIPYVAIDITDPAFEDAKDYMVETATPKANAKIPLTPQIYNDADYCGDFEGLDMANECDTLGDFLKLSEEEKSNIKIGITGILGVPGSEEPSKTEETITNGVAGSQENELPNPETEASSEELLEKTDNPEESHETIDQEQLLGQTENSEESENILGEADSTEEPQNPSVPETDNTQMELEGATENIESNNTNTDDLDPDRQAEEPLQKKIKESDDFEDNQLIDDVEKTKALQEDSVLLPEEVSEE